MNRIGIQPDAFQVPLQLYSLDPAIARLRDVSIPIQDYYIVVQYPRMVIRTSWHFLHFMAVSQFYGPQQPIFVCQPPSPTKAHYFPQEKATLQPNSHKFYIPTSPRPTQIETQQVFAVGTSQLKVAVPRRIPHRRISSWNCTIRGPLFPTVCFLK